jgi:hypothetical protein
VFVLELAETTQLSRIAFDSIAYTGRKSVKDFTVEVSESSARTGFTPVLSGTLQMARPNQVFAFKPDERPVARWVRLTLHSHYGSDSQSFTGFRGYGEQLTHDASLTGLTGNYDRASGWGWIHLMQSGDRVGGIGLGQMNVFLDDARLVVLTLDTLPPDKAKQVAADLMGKI